MRSLSLRRILELTVESATEILSSKSSEVAIDFAFLDLGFRETGESGFLLAEGESATFWATCLRELIEEDARICIPFLPMGILVGSSESRRARLIGEGPGRGTSTFFGPLQAGTLPGFLMLLVFLLGLELDFIGDDAVDIDKSESELSGWETVRFRFLSK
jgi:hypothetical protein